MTDIAKKADSYHCIFKNTPFSFSCAFTILQNAFTATLLLAPHGTTVAVAVRRLGLDDCKLLARKYYRAGF